MRAIKNSRLGLAVIAMALCADPAGAQSGGLFSTLLGTLEGRQPVAPPELVPYASLDPSANAPAVSITITPAAPSTRLGGAVSYCVRLCDGRYFPMTHSTEPATPAKRCSALCPASPTKIYAGNVGSHIAQALAPNGRSYSELRTAFAYRDRLVPDCTCNGKDIFGMAAIAIEADLTLRPGDIVATHKGLTVFIGSKRGVRNARDFRPVDLGPSADVGRKPATVSVATPSEQRRAAQ
jgi:hypothetical protein